MKYADIKDLKLELWLRRRNADEIVWVTKDKTAISIRDMTDSHLINAINHIEQHAEDELMNAFCDYEAENFGDR